MSNDPPETSAANARTYTAAGVQASTAVNTQGLDDVAKKVSTLTTAVQNLNAAIAKVGPGFTSATSSMSRFGQATSSVTGMVGNVGSAMFGAANEKGWVKDFMMFPTRFMRENITQNRQLALSASGALGPQAFASGATTQSMMKGITGFMQSSNVPTGVLGGNPADLLNLMNIMGRVGAGVDWRSQYGAGYGPPGLSNQPRAAGFMRSVYEAQRMNPGQDLSTTAAQIGQYSGNVGAQQQAAFLTGGAFSMIGAGNKQKSISEWAEGILKWLQNLRPGGERGKAFSYGELMAQNFPGSNIDAWLSANGVTEDMKQMFWSYSMAKSNAPTASADQLFSKSEAVNQSVAFQRLQASSAQTRTGFQLAGQMSGAYANKEQANRWMAELMGHMMNEVLPAAMSSGMLSYMQYLPDTIEEMIMQLAERTNLGTLGAGVVGWGSQFPGLFGHSEGGDVPGDVGDFGSYGATTTAGLHPDMKKRVDAMMEANPNLRVTSGLRDLGTQQRLKRKGVGRVSGRPSAHTRGMAADMGPRSQYPWLVKNARKFGLRSGNSAGEPWHVGLGDPDVGQLENMLDLPGRIAQGEEVFNLGFMDSIASMFKGLFGSAFSVGGSPEDQIKGISGGISNLMKGIMGIFSQGEVDINRLKFRDVYSMMVEETNRAPGLPTGGGGGNNWWSNLLRGGFGAAAGAGGGAVGGSGGSFGSKGSPAAATERAIAAARIASRYWQGTALEQAVAIAGRESSWSPWAHRSDKPLHLISGDRGLYQINYSNDPTLMAAGIYQQKSQLFDAETNTKAAYHLYQRAGNSFSPWSMAAGGWTAGGDPMHGAKLDEARAAIQAAGLGDVEEMVGYGIPPAIPSARTAPMVFQNTFNIQGGGSGGSVDMRRTVQVLADQLEDEMRRRMARAN